MPELEVGSKRTPEDSYEDGESTKRSRVESVTMRLLLMGRHCGAVVGKKGQNLEKLRNEHNVTIKMPPTQAADRVFAVVGDVDGCVGVVNDISAACSQAPYPVGQSCPIEINLLASTDSVGMVIGKGGEKLKEIRDQTKANLKVYQECLPLSNERVVAIGGNTQEEVVDALRMILLILKDASHATLICYDPNNKPSEIMGTGITGSGISMMEHGAVPMNDAFQQLQTVTTITVPNDMCGAIIGKGGIRIKEVRNTSGAKIDFSESNRETNEDRVITISGTQQQVNVAEQLMAQCVQNRTM